MRRIDRIDGELLGVDERPRSTGPAVTPPALRHNLRHRAGQRRGVAAGSDGAARARLGRYEPCAAPDCSNATVRPAGPNTNAPSTWPRATSVRCPPADPACRWSTSPAALTGKPHPHSRQAWLRLLPARARARRLPLRQRLRALAELPHRVTFTAVAQLAGIRGQRSSMARSFSGRPAPPQR